MVKDEGKGTTMPRLLTLYLPISSKYANTIYYMTVQSKELSCQYLFIYMFTASHLPSHHRNSG